MKIKVFWDIMSCSLAGVDRRFALMMDAVHTSETSVYSSKTHCAIFQKTLIFIMCSSLRLELDMKDIGDGLGIFLK
jgi:hypothetical protein